MIESVATGLLAASVLPASLVPIFYSLRPWYLTPQGRALMLMAVGLMFLVILAFARTVFGDYPGRHVYRLIGFSLFAPGVYYLFWSLLTSPGAREYPPRSWLDRGGPSRTIAAPPGGPMVGNLGVDRDSPEALPRALTGDAEPDGDLLP